MFPLLPETMHIATDDYIVNLFEGSDYDPALLLLAVRHQGKDPWEDVRAELADPYVWYNVQTGDVAGLPHMEECEVRIASCEVRWWRIRVLRELKITMPPLVHKLKPCWVVELKSLHALGFVEESRSASTTPSPDDQPTGSSMRIDDDNDIRTEEEHVEAQIQREAAVLNAEASFEQMEPIVWDRNRW